jgi:hypothetical protein
MVEVERLAADPLSYPEWIEPLNSLEPRGDGTYVADVGYFGQPNHHLMRSIDGGAHEFGLESVADDPLIRWTLAVSAAGDAGTRASFAYEKGGSGTVFGVSADSPVFQVSLEVLSERSLERLERLVASRVAGEVA